MEITNLKIDYLSAFNNAQYEGLRIGWSASTGIGTCDIYRMKESNTWMADTEHMGRDFLKKLLAKVADTIDISE